VILIRWPTFRARDSITKAEFFLKPQYHIGFLKASTLKRKITRPFLVLVMGVSNGKMVRMQLQMPADVSNVVVTPTSPEVDYLLTNDSSV